MAHFAFEFMEDHEGDFNHPCNIMRQLTPASEKVGYQRQWLHTFILHSDYGGRHSDNSTVVSLPESD